VTRKGREEGKKRGGGEGQEKGSEHGGCWGKRGGGKGGKGGGGGKGGSKRGPSSISPFQGKVREKGGGKLLRRRETERGKKKGEKGPSFYFNHIYMTGCSGHMQGLSLWDGRGKERGEKEEEREMDVPQAAFISKSSASSPPKYRGRGRRKGERGIT